MRPNPLKGGLMFVQLLIYLVGDDTAGHPPFLTTYHPAVGLLIEEDSQI